MVEEWPSAKVYVAEPVALSPSPSVMVVVSVTPRLAPSPTSSSSFVVSKSLPSLAVVDRKILLDHELAAGQVVRVIQRDANGNVAVFAANAANDVRRIFLEQIDGAVFVARCLQSVVATPVFCPSPSPPLPAPVRLNV